MDILKTIAGNPDLVRQMAGALGVGESDTRGGIEALLPHLARGIQRNTRQTGGLDALTDALSKGNHRRYVEEPEIFSQAATRAEGNGILGHIFGSKDVSRNVAGSAAQRSGLSSDLLKQLLPSLASAAMGALAKESDGGRNLGAGRGAAPSSGLGMLGGLLDSDGDGSALDDVLNLAKKLF